MPPDSNDIATPPTSSTTLPVPVQQGEVLRPAADSWLVRAIRSLFGWKAGSARADIQVVLDATAPDDETSFTAVERTMLRNILALHDRRIADVMATEASIFYFALASWRRKPFVPSGALAFSSHKRNGYAGILYTLVLLTLVETVALDFVIRVSHPQAANVVLVVDIIAAVWLLGFARATQLRPTTLSADTLAVRMGLQWSARIARSAPLSASVTGSKRARCASLLSVPSPDWRNRGRAASAAAAARVSVNASSRVKSGWVMPPHSPDGDAGPVDKSASRKV